MEQCPCGSQLSYATCCGMYITGQAQPQTPEQLMRSRYTAYTQANIDYIANTMRGPAAKGFNAVSAREWASSVEWLGLEVLSSSTKGPTTGFVEFLVYFREKNKRHAIHEVSEFHLEDGAWYYVDGKKPAKRPPFPQKEAGRNDPCICGSGIKYKKCCGSMA